MNFYKDNKGRVYAIPDIKEFWIYNPETYLIPITYEQYKKQGGLF